MSPAAAGLIVVVLVVLATYAAFTKRNPLHHGFQLKGVFTSAVNVGKNTPVRIAGVNVGTVRGDRHYNGSSVAVVTMSLDNGALPLHSDADDEDPSRASSSEGNFFVDITPRQPVGPGPEVGSDHPDHPDRRPSAARPGAERAQQRHPHRPAGAAWPPTAPR